MSGSGLRSGQVADAAGVNIQTLRYYERRGLLAEPDRSPGGHRLYGEDAVTVLRVIKAAQRLGFTLEEVAELLEAGRHRHGRPVPGLQERAAAKLAEVDAKIADLTDLFARSRCDRGGARHCGWQYGCSTAVAAWSSDVRGPADPLGQREPTGEGSAGRPAPTGRHVATLGPAIPVRVLVPAGAAGQGVAEEGQVRRYGCKAGILVRSHHRSLLISGEGQIVDGRPVVPRGRTLGFDHGETSVRHLTFAQEGPFARRPPAVIPGYHGCGIRTPAYRRESHGHTEAQSGPTTTRTPETPLRSPD
jgi:DNA-binding transcriptional MerR regulator